LERLKRNKTGTFYWNGSQSCPEYVLIIVKRELTGKGRGWGSVELEEKRH